MARWVLGESLLLGIIGALVGTPVGVGAAALTSWLVTRSIGYGLVVPWARLGVIAGLSVFAAAAVTRLHERYPADVSLQSAIQEPEPVDMAFGSSPISNRHANGMLVGFSSDALHNVRTTPGVEDAGLFRTSEPVTIIAGLQLTVVVVVAMVGVANTLGLSVIERTRESALLRALGRAVLRTMLLAVTLMLSGVAVVVRLVLGIGAGWAGAAAVLMVEGAPTPLGLQLQLFTHEDRAVGG